MDVITQALIASLGLAVGLSSYAILSSEFKRRRLKRKVRCFFGGHAPSAIQHRGDGLAFQYCEYCDAIVAMYDVDDNNTYRRIR